MEEFILKNQEMANMDIHEVKCLVRALETNYQIKS